MNAGDRVGSLLVVADRPDRLELRGRVRSSVWMLVAGVGLTALLAVQVRDLVREQGPRERPGNLLFSLFGPVLIGAGLVNLRRRFVFDGRGRTVERLRPPLAPSRWPADHFDCVFLNIRRQPDVLRTEEFAQLGLGHGEELIIGVAPTDQPDTVNLVLAAERIAALLGLPVVGAGEPKRAKPAFADALSRLRSMQPAAPE